MKEREIPHEELIQWFGHSVKNHNFGKPDYVIKYWAFYYSDGTVESVTRRIKLQTTL